MNQTAFDDLLAALAENRREAGEKYLLLVKNLIRYFEVRGINNAESAADEVINRLARKLSENREIENVSTYSLGIARMVALELRRSPEQKTSNELPEIGYVPAEEEESGERRELVCLDKCLSEIPAEKKQIIIGYYRGERREKIENRRKMAENLGIPQNALRSRAVRLRGKLELCIRKCLQK